MSSTQPIALQPIVGTTNSSNSTAASSRTQSFPQLGTTAPPPAQTSHYLTVFFRSVGARILLTWRKQSRPKAEEKKIAIDRSFRLALIRCSVHFLPVSACIILITLNINGYFIGRSFQGSTNHDAIDSLSLQVAAKMMELLIVASLTTIVLGMVRYELTLGKEGLPFGLLGSAFAFKDISFFWSPNLWYGGMVISSKRTRARIVLSLIAAGLLATLAGPSSALLMIPPMRGFLLGGSSFWFKGNQSLMWPSRLDAQHIGGSWCSNSSYEMLHSRINSTWGCIWASTSALTEVFKGWRMSTRDYVALTLADGAYQRSILLRASASDLEETWAGSSSCALAAFSRKLAFMWGDALDHAPIAQTGASSYFTLRFRVVDTSFATTDIRMPLARVKCFNTSDIMYGNNSALQFPIFINHGYDIEYSSYNMEVTHMNSSSILTQWLPVPQTPLMGTVAQPIRQYPSSFLAIQVPQSDKYLTSFSCAVDAYWAQGSAIYQPVWQFGGTQRGSIPDFNDPYILGDYSPISPQLVVDLDWLYALTPILNTTNSTSPKQARTVPHWTGLGYMLSEAGLHDLVSTINQYDDWSSVTSGVETVIAMLMVEGMSRIGYADNIDGDMYYTDKKGTSYLYSGYGTATDDFYNSFLKGDSKFAVPPIVDVDGLTKMEWKMTSTGYAYLADSTAYYLAIAVLFSYIAIAFAHMSYVLLRREHLSSDTWDSFEEMIALSFTSTPPDQALANTSTGIRSSATLKKRLRIRVAEGGKRVVGREEVQLLLDAPLDADYKNIEQDVQYGVVD